MRGYGSFGKIRWIKAQCLTQKRWRRGHDTTNKSQDKETVLRSLNFTQKGWEGLLSFFKKGNEVTGLVLEDHSGYSVENELESGKYGNRETGQDVSFRFGKRV